MIFRYVAKTRRQHLLHVETGIGRQNDLLIVVSQLLITNAAVVTGNAVLTASDVGSLMLRDRCDGMERDRVPNRLRTTFPHVMREGEGTTEFGSYDLEASIGSASASEAKVMQKHGHGDQLGIGLERAMMC